MPDLASRIEHATGRRPVASRTAGAGASGSVVRVTFADGSTLIAKHARHDEVDLTIEARGLELLARRSRLPVPAVIAAEPDLLLLEDMPGSSGLLHTAEEDAARAIAGLHTVTSPDGRYGLDHDGLIGPLTQLNSTSSSWVEFFRDRRLLAMTEAAAGEGSLPLALAERLERIAARLSDLVPDHPPASLIHGDIWSGNVLALDGRVTAFLDPAPYHAHAEVELAFIGLFSTFGPGFFDRYHELRGTSGGERREFEARRRAVYNLYPLLVHVRIFGESYLPDLETTLRAAGG
ncbi:MAG: fructosamine kinase family protein [Phycisphaerales bacterium]|nr:fructosamine kinase family protein [Phycisphaerales bacterium]